jgi:hypothetical protein
VDVSTLNGKFVMGYQGWFSCPADGSPLPPGRWWYWFQENTTPDAPNLTVDMWPDTSELGTNELFPTNMTYSDERRAALYSAFTTSAVDRHFSWMRYNNLDGVMLQRFLSDLQNPVFKAFRDQVTTNVKTSAEAHGRGFCIMYDISDYKGNSIVDDLRNDWSYLVDDLKVTDSPNYLKHKGNPLLGIWGLGFTDRPGTASEASELIAYFRRDSAQKYRCTLLGGVPTYWRTLDPNGDSKTDPAWKEAYRSFDVVSPWSVGRFVDDADADSFRDHLIVPDLLELTPLGIDYMPVVFPGYSARNKGNGAFNQIHRHGGLFWWRQVYNAVLAGCTMVYGAMFDEVDEGTAMFKIVADKQNLPKEAQDRLVYLNIDGYHLPSDWYLHLADEGSKMLRHEISPTPVPPIQPG